MPGLSKTRPCGRVDPEPMATIEDVFQDLSKDRHFSKIDHRQFPIREEDVQKTGFVTPDGEYGFLRMPFGMVNSGAGQRG